MHEGGVPVHTVICLLAVLILAAAPGNRPATTRSTQQLQMRRAGVRGGLPTTRSVEQLQALATQPAGELRVDVIEAKVSERAAEGLEVDRIAPPDHPVDRLLAKLRELGTAKLIVRDTRPISVSSDDILLRFGRQVPFVVGRNVYAGQTQTNVSYQDVGAIIRLRTSPWQQDQDGKKVSAVNAVIEYSGMAEHGVETNPGRGDEAVFAPVFVKMMADQAVKLRSGEPVLISTIKRVAEPERRPVEYVVLVVRMELTAE
jgi:hypothetical protein